MDVFIDPRFEAEYARRPLVLVDVGARGGLKKNWSAAARHLRLLGFEPDATEYRRLADAGQTSSPSRIFLNTALAGRPGPIELHVARDAGLSSVFEPNRPFLDAFPDADRFDIVDTRTVPADTLDRQLREHSLADVDFIKVDTQGSELMVLHGASETLASPMFGVEVEVEFAPVYRDQPLFAEVDQFLRGLGYQLFDLRPVFWKRASGRHVGGPRGQIVWADALYFRTPAAFSAALAPLPSDEARSKILRALSMSLLYGYCDLALDVLRSSAEILTADDRVVIERRVREAGKAGALNAFPGRRLAAAVLHRLWRLTVRRDDAWSVSRSEIGNLD